MKIELIASDLDCTIIDKNNNISPKNFDAIQKIHTNNIPFVICTGKSYSVSKKICDTFKAEYGIFGNGTQIIDFQNNKEIFKKTLTKKDLLFISTIVKRFNFHLHLYTTNEIITENLEYMDLRNFVLRNTNAPGNLEFKIVNNITDYIEEYYNDVFSAVVSSSDTSLSEFEKLLSINNNIEYSFINKRGIYRDNVINKDYEYLIISPTNVNKDEALNILCESLNISKKNVLSIGDNVNDLEMVKNSGIGVAVNDAYDELKLVATYTTNSTVENGAFAEAIFKYLK